MSLDEKPPHKLPETLLDKTWFGFDLDDTLHEFRKASRAATTACLLRIAEEHELVFEELQAEYQAVWKRGTTDAFVDGRSSHDYRRERFGAVFAHFLLDDQVVDGILDDYESTLNKNLELKPGATSLLSSIKAMGGKIVIITEGPQDAQERTIQHLGISEYVDFLATTNFYRVSKTEGLFSKALHHLQIEPGDLVFIGDSIERDIEPAQAKGIDVIHYAEELDTMFDSSLPRINSLELLRDLLIASPRFTSPRS